MKLNENEPVKPANVGICRHIYPVQYMLLLFKYYTSFSVNWVFYVGNFEGLNFAGIFIRGSLILRFFHNREIDKLKTHEIKY